MGIKGYDKLSIAAVPSEFEDIFTKAVMSDERNNHAVKIYSWEDMLRLSSEDFVNNAPPIDDLVPPEKGETTGD